ncbi:MAG: hypothetical protein K2X10_08315 [Hyphomicrobiales bacterium]|nr:hypothetical protein [Hyphomicrobiales bacterium]OQW82267.1 MAG: hypothetical protein BVN31_09030 [Proteobacteria bacterium ST_bin15]
MGHLVIIRSERGGEGRTLIAHLLTAFLMDRGVDWYVFSSAAREIPQRSQNKQRFAAVNIHETAEQVRFVDTIMRAPDAWTLLDLAQSDYRAFLDFCDYTGIIADLAENGVETWSMRVYSQPLRDVRASFWPDCLVDAREILVVNNSSPAHLRDWRSSPIRTELTERRVPEFVLPRMDEGAIQHYLSQRLPLSDFLAKGGGSGKDVFARAQLAKLFQVFQPQVAQLLLSRDLGRLSGPMFQ